MKFQAVIGSRTLKSFTKSLACLSRYGDDVILRITPDALTLNAINSSKTAFFSVKFTSEYFDKYKVTVPTPPGLTFQTPPDSEEAEKFTGQLLVKSLLSILRHKTIEKTVDRCDLSIMEGGQESDPAADAEEDSLESKLVVRLHCKHGVVKTHRLLLLTPTNPLGPQITPSLTESHVTVGPRALKDMLEHFPQAKGAKSDPQLIWLFGINDVRVKSKEFGGNAKGVSQIATEITMSADEFDSYNIYKPLVSLAFHLREFNATIALAESLSVALKLTFTEAMAPVYIQFDTDTCDTEFLFVISTTGTVYDTPSSSKTPGAVNLRKRDREQGQNEESTVHGEGAIRAVKRKPMRAAIRATSSVASQVTPERHDTSTPSRILQADPPNAEIPSVSGAPEQMHGREPLFLPGASQLSNADLDILRLSGLGIEHMDFAEFEAMMDAEGEEVGMSTAVGGNLGDTGDMMDQYTDPRIGDEEQMAPSQVPVERRGDKEFRPLFDD